MQAGGNALGHEPVISRMVLHEIPAKALGIVDCQRGRISLGNAREIEHRRRAPTASECRERRRFAIAAVRAHGVLQRPVAAIEIDVNIRWRLVRELVRGKRKRSDHWCALYRS